MRYKICILSTCILPIPDVKGGAVERLITMVLDENEKNPRFDITVITSPDENAFILQQSYKHTNFVNIKGYTCSLLTNFVHKIQWHAENRFHLNSDWLVYLISPVSRWVIKHRREFEFFVGECAGPDFFCNASKIIGRNKFCIHLHANVISNPRYERSVGNVISVSNFIMNQFAKTSALSNERMAIVFNGISTDLFNKKITMDEKKQIREKYGFKTDDFVIIFCGRIVPEKGVKELIEAVVLLNNPHIKLLILGSSHFGLGNIGDYPEKIKSLALENKDKIFFSGFVNNYDLYKYHQIANIGVVPSIYNDPCPLSLFELITSGLPTIATKAGGMVEIGTEETTMFVPLENLVDNLEVGIKILYEDSDLCEKMSKAALVRSHYFKRERFFNDFCETINRFIELNNSIR